MPKKKRRNRTPPEPPPAAEPKVFKVRKKKRRTNKARKPKTAEPIAIETEPKSLILRILEAQRTTVNVMEARLRRYILE
jgi:hypothetical protein